MSERPATAQGLANGVAGIGSLLPTRAVMPLPRAMLFDTRPDDALSIGAAIVVILIVVAVACVVPLFRVLRLNPVEGLRVESAASALALAELHGALVRPFICQSRSTA